MNETTETVPEVTTAATDARTVVERKRELEQSELLTSLEGVLELPMLVLSVVFLILFVVDVAAPISPEVRRTISLIQWAIWVAFVIEYAIKLALAPNKPVYLKSNWLATTAIVLPMFRVLRAASAAKAARSLGALRVVTLGNRTIVQLGVLFRRRRLHYLIAVASAVMLLGGVGMYYIERTVRHSNILTVGDGLWWAAGATTTVGTELYPVTAEGRVLALIVMAFGVGVFGYIAASLASLFVHIDRSDEQEEERASQPDGENNVDDLTEQIARLETTIAELTRMTAVSYRAADPSHRE